jgi:hypothetical protein
VVYFVKQRETFVRVLFLVEMRTDSRFQYEALAISTD